MEAPRVRGRAARWGRISNRVRQQAQGLVEYALLLVFIAVVAVVAVASLGTGVVSLYSRASFAF